MKKILLGSTVLVGAAALFAGAAFAAETPKVTIGGTADFQYGYVSQDQDSDQRSSALRNDTEVTLRIDGKTDAGLQYGGGIDLEADTTRDADNQATTGEADGNASRTFLYVGGSFGRVEAGSTPTVAQTTKVDASSIARATGGIDGAFTYFTNATSGSVIATPDLILAYGAGQLGDESKDNLTSVNYYTPRFAGVQLGVSYLGNNTDRGQTIALAKGTSVLNIWQGSINYEGKISGVSVAAAATGEHGKTSNLTLNDLRTYQVGGKLGYQGFSLAGSYGSWGDSLQAKSTSSDDDTNYWTAGVAYETGPFGASVTYLSSEFDNGVNTNDFTNLSFGADYKLAPGFTPYAEVSFVELDVAGGTTNDNDATVAIVGTQLSF